MMRLRHIPLLFACLIIAFSSGEVLAQASIAVVDVQKLLTESNAAKSVQKQSQAKRESFLDGLSKQEQELRKQEKELAELKSKLSQEEFVKKRQEFDKKFIETRKLAQQQKRALDEAVIKAMRKLRDKLYEIVQEIADERNYNLVISKQNVVVGENSLEITDETMKRLNSELSEVKLELNSK